MDNLVQQCIDLIIDDNVDEVLLSLNDAYFWSVEKNFTGETYKNNNVLQQFLNQISLNLLQKQYTRRVIRAEEANTTVRSREAIGKIIQQFLKALSPDERIEFLGKLTAGYALAVPESLFRVAKSFSGLHQTANIPPIDDSLPMTDEMILFAWQYFWFYSWLGY